MGGGSSTSQPVFGDNSMSLALSKPPSQRETGWAQSRRRLASSGPRFPLRKILQLDQILGSSPSYDILQSRAGTCLLGSLEHHCWTSRVGLGPLKPCRQQVTPSTAGRVSCFFCLDSRPWKLFRNNKQARNICIRNHAEQYMLFRPSLVGNRSKKQLRQICNANQPSLEQSLNLFWEGVVRGVQPETGRKENSLSPPHHPQVCFLTLPFSRSRTFSHFSLTLPSSEINGNNLSSNVTTAYEFFVSL